MSLEILGAKSALKELLVDTFANLADEKRIRDHQMPLFTADTKVQVYMGDDLLFDISGTPQLEETSPPSPPTSSAHIT